MAQFDVSLSLDTDAALGMIEKFCMLAGLLGRDEAEQRLGRPIDEAYFGELMAIEYAGGTSAAVHFRLVPTAEFERAMAALA